MTTTTARPWRYARPFATLTGDDVPPHLMGCGSHLPGEMVAAECGA